jgi:biopolymer transport protein ExbD
VIPMINVIFLLLLYFMVAGSIQSDHNVAPPFSSQLAEPPPYIPLLIVSHDNKMWFENRKVTFVDLQKELSSASAYKKLKIHADSNVEALSISKIMNIAAEAGILQFVLVTQRRIDPA